MSKITKQQNRSLRHNRVRAKISGTASRPRLSVFRSSTHVYAQVIDDAKGHTIAAASTKEVKTKAVKVDKSAEVGKMIAAKAQEKGIKQVVFDRGGYRYQGRVKALAEAARAGGLEF